MLAASGSNTVHSQPAHRQQQQLTYTAVAAAMRWRRKGEGKEGNPVQDQCNTTLHYVNRRLMKTIVRCILNNMIAEVYLQSVAFW